MRDNDSQKIIVVGIAKTLDDAALAELFGSFGTVADAKVVLDVNTQQSRGFGFVTFTSGAAMRQAIQQMDKKVVDGRTLNVRQLVPKDKFQAERAKSEPVPQDAASRPCWLLRKGKCTKGDLCPFSHETKNGEFGSCFEFMQTGECRRGDKCIFSHNIASDKQEGDGEGEGSAQSTEAVARKPQEPKKTQADKTTKTEPTAATGGEQKQRVCYAYQKGKCHRGKKCLYLHEKVPEMANDKPVVVAKAAVAGAKRGEFEVVQVEGGGRKRSRAEDSHDDDSGGDDDDDDEAYSKPPPAKKEPQQQAQTQKRSAPAAATSAPAPASKGPAARAPAQPVISARAPRPAPAPRSQPPAAQPKASAQTQGEESEKPPRVTEESSKRLAEKRPRDAESSKTSKPALEKRPRFDTGARQPFDQREHPAAKRIYEREAKLNGPSKYAPGPSGQAAPQRGNKSKGGAGDRFAKRAAQNNKNALQRQKRRDRAAAGVQPQDGHQAEGGERPPPQTAAPPRRAEKVDMGAAFDSDGERKPRGGGGGGGRPRVVDKAQQRANREKMQQERRAKRDAKKSALGRLQTQGE